MSSYSEYPRTIHSSVNWLGYIPAHWKVVRIKYLTQVKRGASPRPIDDPKYFDDEGEFAWVRIADVSSSDRYLKKTTQRLSEIGEQLSVKRFPGDIFLSIAGSVGKPIITNIKCCIHDGFVYFPDYRENISFLYYLFDSGQPYLGLGKMGTQLNLNTDTVGSIKVGLPPADEQQKIVNFLDHKTAQIDALIAKKQSLLDKLAEQRTALISQAVTKGLNDAVPMKESNVAWLGEVPRHWETKRLRFLMTMSGGLTPRTSESKYWGGDIPWVSPKDMKSERLTSSVDTLTENALKETTLQLYPAGKVLIVVRGMILAHTFPVAVNEVPVTVNQDMKVLETTMNPEYLAVLLRGIQSLVLSIVEESAHGTKVLRTDFLKNVVLPVPPRVEQDEIVSEVAKISTRIDKMMSTVKGVINKLQEYRAALITNAVTGKIDVRDYFSSTTTEQKDIVHGPYSPLSDQRFIRVFNSTLS